MRTGLAFVVWAGVEDGVRAGFWWMRSGFEEKGLVGSGWTVNCDGGGPGFMVKVTKQGLSLEIPILLKIFFT